MLIDELKPGRELDALVAEKVMGWEQHYAINLSGAPVPMAASPEFMYPPSGSDDPERVPYYSTDIAAAMQVVEKFAADNWEVSVGWSIADSAWISGIGLDGHGWDVEYGDSAPHAVCLAALKATEAADGEDKAT